MEKPKINTFSKRLASIPVLTLSFVAVLLVGLLWILFPILDGASEVFFPGSPCYLIELFIVAVVVILFHITCFILALIYRRSVKYLVYMLIPLCLLVVLNYFLWPTGRSRVDSFQLGARYRIAWVGGASKVRQEALTLLDETPEISIPRPKWPDSIHALRASDVQVDKDKGIVDVEIPRRRWFFWGDQLGYLITDANATAPVIIDDPRIANGHRLWKISEGIYLYQKWP
jgi:hypothetical protein